MRILLVFIIILNLLYVGWEMISPVKRTSDLAPMPSHLKSLELLNEDKIELLKSAKNETLVTAGMAHKSADNKMVDETELNEKQAEAGNNTITCYTLGPFKDKNIMQQLRESIAEYVTHLSMRKHQQSIKHRYWVYVPPLANKKQAKRVAKELRQKQLNDFYIVLSGATKYSISLGHFREPSHANRRMKKVADLGFNAQIKVIYREYDIFWLDYQVDSLGQGANFSADEYVSDGVSQLVRECDS